MANAVRSLGVIGAGTMGSGIALAALLADLRVVLYDLDPGMLEKAQGYLQQHLEKKKKSINLKYARLTGELQDLAGCQVIIEAAPEQLEIKRELFARLDTICPPPAILATNTSTLPVTAIAASTTSPQRVAGMHFFNPAPLMPLIEVVRAAQSSDETITALLELARRLGKTPVEVRDTPGFIVNRVARPFYGEALRIAGEASASIPDIDAIARLAGGFRMGPFELMDLIGIDINFAATQSIFQQTFYEPRYRPHWLQAEKVAQKALGRKSGRGFYSYDPPQTAAPDVAHPPAGTPGTVLLSPGSWAPGLAEKITQAGGQVVDLEAGHHIIDGDYAAGVVAASQAEGLAEHLAHLERTIPDSCLLLCQCSEAMLGDIRQMVRYPERLVGFDGLFFAGGKAATLVEHPSLAPAARQSAGQFCQQLGLRPIWMQDSPGLILPRLIATLTNEAAFAAGEGAASPETIDLAMQLGTNYPQGPLAWGKQLGLQKIVRILAHLMEEYGEDRYRVAPWLKRSLRWEPH